MPLNDVTDLNFQHGLFISGGSVGYYGGDIKRLSEDMKALKPTVMPAVPRLLNRIYDKVVGEVSGSFIKRTLYNMALGAKESELKRYTHHCASRQVTDVHVTGAVRETSPDRKKLIA